MTPSIAASREEQLKLGKPFLREATLTLKKSLSLDISALETVQTALHELGHADQAARNPAKYYRYENVFRNPKGRLIPRNRRPVEVYANKYTNKILPPWRR